MTIFIPLISSLISNHPSGIILSSIRKTSHFCGDKSLFHFAQNYLYLCFKLEDILCMYLYIRITFFSFFLTSILLSKGSGTWNNYKFIGSCKELYKEASDTLHAACSIVAQYEN